MLLILSLILIGSIESNFPRGASFFSKTRLRFDVALADAVAALGVINLRGIQRGIRYMWQARCAVYTFASLIRRVGCGAVALAVAILLAAICSASSIPADTSSILAVAACCRRMRDREREREKERDEGETGFSCCCCW